MATGGKLQDDFLTCSVCMEVFNQPVTLACQHSFCQNCLKKYMYTRPEASTNKSIPCPTCRQDTPVPHPDRPVEEWAGQLKPGLLLTGLMDSVVDETNRCSWCNKEGKTTPASTWCADCQGCLCDECLMLHTKVPVFSNHDMTKLTGHRQQKLKRPFMCKEHQKKIKLFCKDCKKPLCTVCCSINHRKCDDVVTIQAMLPEVKDQLLKSQENIEKIVEKKKAEIDNYGDEVDKFLVKSASVKTEITKTIQAAVDHLREKEAELLEKLDVETNQQTEKLRSQIETKQTATQMYQQQSQFIQQALELEDEAQLFEMFLSSGTEARVDITGTQREDMVDVADIAFIHTIDGLKDEIGMTDVSSVDNTTAALDLKATPVLHEVVDATLDGSCTCSIRDVVVLKQSNTKVILFTDFENCHIKSFYMRKRQTCSNVLNVSPKPWCITVINDNTVAVSFNGLKQIITVAVTPDLKLLSTIQTSKTYWGLATLDQSTLVAGSNSPPSVDLIDMTGNIVKTFSTLTALRTSFREPNYIHVARQGTILVSDSGLKSVICLTRSGDIVFKYKPTADRALEYPYGITSTSAGDILVADWGTAKVIHLSESGQFVRDILTAKDGLRCPFGLCFDDDKLCVTVKEKGLHQYKFVTG